jgi:phosphohistidine phosphatase
VIWLLRHGDAADGTPDAERPLTDKGRRQSRAAGEALQALGVALDACLTSPKVRAAQTAELACAGLGIDPQTEPELSGGPFDAEALSAGLGDNVMLVGHDPDFSMAVHDLTGARVKLKKGGLAGVDGSDLIVLLRPKELRGIAGS